MTSICARGTGRLGSGVATTAGRPHVALNASCLQPSAETFEPVCKPVVPFERFPDRDVQFEHGLLGSSMHLGEGGVLGGEAEHALSFIDRTVQGIRGGPPIDSVFLHKASGDSPSRSKLTFSRKHSSSTESALP
jgi:hypothetical protein